MSNSSDSTNQADEIARICNRQYDKEITIAEAAQQLSALFNQAQQQLLRELIEQLPEKRVGTEKVPLNDIERAYDIAIEDVTALLNKKLQAYGGDE